MTNNIFWHICELNNWSDIVNDQYFSIIKSNLINNIDNIFISFTGKNKDNINFLLKRNVKNQLINFTTKYEDYERACLRCLLDWSKHNSSNILYIHSKGVSHPKNKNVWNWRKMLEKVVIFNHQTCVKKLKNYDVVGVNLSNAGKKYHTIINEKHRLHFSGNFWWSKTDYIKTLPPIREDLKNLSIDGLYWLCERWIMVNYPNNKYHEIYRSPSPRYYKNKLDVDIEKIKLS